MIQSLSTVVLLIYFFLKFPLMEKRVNKEIPYCSLEYVVL